MAITKIHPIKSTLKKAIDYIVDPAKTDDKLLVSSFGCAVETADLEFEKTRLLAMQKGNNLAHHLIQAFEPGEVSYAQAHEIGRQLADEILGGKYEYVIATHINKEHCHNHIIFCAVDFAEHKKYVSNRKSYAQIRRVSDRLCRENGLSVVTPGAERGKQYAEWDAQRKGTSYKQKLKIAIVTGAEGGFAAEEAEMAAKAGARTVGLGPRILRCETAPLAVLASVMTLTGNLE